jgi:hypothetical protein
MDWERYYGYINTSSFATSSLLHYTNLLYNSIKKTVGASMSCTLGRKSVYKSQICEWFRRNGDGGSDAEGNWHKRELYLKGVILIVKIIFCRWSLGFLFLPLGRGIEYVILDDYSSRMLKAPPMACLNALANSTIAGTRPWYNPWCQYSRIGIYKPLPRPRLFPLHYIARA